MVTGRDDVVGLDSSIILPRQTWVASGHVGEFTDPLTECQSCHKRFRVDHMQEAVAERGKKGKEVDPDSVPLADIACPNCGTRGQWTEPRNFNMMLKTYLGVIEDESGLHYLRPETAQGIFINFLNVMPGLAQEAAVRHRPDRQELPQRDHARQLHLPHPRVRADGDGVLRQARRGRAVAPVLDRRAHPLVHRPRHQPRQPAPLRAPRGEAVALLQAHRRHRVPLQLHRQRVGRARGHRQPHRLRPHDAHASTRAPTWSTSTRPTRREVHALRHRAGGRPVAHR